MIERLGPLSALQGVAGMDKAAQAAKTFKPEQGSFTDIIKEVLDTASASAQKSNNLNQRLQMDDPTVSLEESVIASNISSLQFTAIVQTRNKIVQAYSEIMNMPV